MIYLGITFLSIISSLICTNKKIFPVEIDEFLKSKTWRYASFFTFWVRIFFITTLFLYIFDFLQCKFLKKNFVIKKVLSIFYTNCLCFSFIMTVIYWPFQIQNYKNFYPQSLISKGIRIPVFTEFSLHVLPLLYLLLIKNKIEFSTSLINIFFMIATGMLYGLLSFYSFLKKKEWVYPCMENFTFTGNFFSFLLSFKITLVFFLILRHFELNKLKNKKNIEKGKKILKRGKNN